MATNLEQVQRYLVDLELNFNYREEQEDIIVFFTTENFVNINGEKFLIVVIECADNGNLLQIFSPQLYKVPQNANKHALFELLLLLMQDTYYVKFEYYDQRDEIRICIDLPLEDQDLTKEQLRLCVYTLANTIDQYHNMISKTIETGLVQRENSQLLIIKTLFDQIIEEYSEDL